MEKIAHKIEEKERTADIQLKHNVPFMKMNLYRHSQKGLTEAGFVYPTRLQANAIQLGKAGIDLLIQSKAGTGKTLIFATIVLESYRQDIREPQSLIIAPTREIAIQIEYVLKEIGKFCQGFKVISAIGGLDVNDDRKKIQSAKVIVGTPGRILHLIRNEIFNISRIRLLVLDEADKIIASSELCEDFKAVEKYLPTRKQFIACSATFSNDLDQQLAKYMRNPLHVSSDKRATLLIGIKQFVHEISDSVDSAIAEIKKKTDVLNTILSKIPFKQCLMFTNLLTRADTYAQLMESNGWPCSVITGKLNQKQRSEIFKKFREFKIKILVATDLMARGIDSENVNLVVNLEAPDNSPTYLHRIGRAGRFGSYGIAITIISSDADRMKFSEILTGIDDFGDVTVLKFPIEQISDLWDYTNLDEEKKKFGIFKPILPKNKNNKTGNVENNQNVENCDVNDTENLKVTDSPSSSSYKQFSMNVTTLDDASSLAVDSDVHLDIPQASTSKNCHMEKQSSPSKKSRKSLERKKKQKDVENCERSKCVVEVHVDGDGEKISSKKIASDKEKPEDQTNDPKFKNVAISEVDHDKSNELQSDVGNSSGGETRTIIDFKSLVVDKEMAALKSMSDNIFADYESFKEQSSDKTMDNGEIQPSNATSSNIFYDAESSSKADKNDIPPSNTSENNIFDDYESSSKEEPKENSSKNETNDTRIEDSIVSVNAATYSIPNSCAVNVNEFSINDNEKSSTSFNLPKAPNPSPKEQKPQSMSSFHQINENQPQLNLNKLCVQNLPSFDLPPRDDNSDLDTTTEEDYSSTSSAEMNTRSSGFDERPTSLGSSGIVTSTDYSEESENSYQTSDSNDDDDNDFSNNEYATDYDEEEKSDDSSSTNSLKLNENSVVDITNGDHAGDEESNENQKQSKVNETTSAGVTGTAATAAAAATTSATVEENLENDPTYRYQRAYTLWTNMYWNQLTQIQDYVKFSKYVKQNAHKY